MNGFFVTNEYYREITAMLGAYNEFVRRLLDPEDLGRVVTAEVRDEVRELLGMPRVETTRPPL